jgi:hypothetical protein
MQDGSMGSLSLLFVSQSKEKRVFGEQISECRFLDKDGVDVIASLNVDQDGTSGAVSKEYVFRGKELVEYLNSIATSIK